MSCVSGQIGAQHRRFEDNGSAASRRYFVIIRNYNYNLVWNQYSGYHWNPHAIDDRIYQNAGIQFHAQVFALIAATTTKEQQQ